jgi:uncharacterized iron-regulated membrane protein
MKKMRKIHLWIGLITSLFLFMESMTGLILLNPWLVGASKEKGFHRDSAAFVSQNPTNPQEGTFLPSQGQEMGKPRGEEQGILGIVKGLHEGKMGDVNIKWAIDLTGIGMMILTATGIYLSVKILKAERKRRKKYEMKAGLS